MTEEIQLHGDPNMDSAGMELMALSWRLAEIPDLADDARRVAQIGAWISSGRMSDLEKSMVKVMGSMVEAMRRRNYVFHDDRPIAGQFEEFLSQIPDPLPGEIGYVDQKTLPPLERRDTFEAEVEMSEVNRWTAQDDVERVITRKAVIVPKNGVRGEAMIYAEGERAQLVIEGKATLKLRARGGALQVQ